MLFGKKIKKVLIIDDDRSLLRQISFRLKKHEGFDTVVAEDGQSGLLAAANQHLDLIILDWTLPDISGIDVLATLKTREKTKNTPIMMLTGHNKIGEIDDAFALGADAYVIKPCSLQKLGEKSRLLIQS